MNLVSTDPPYGISKNNGMEKLYQKSKIALRSNPFKIWKKVRHPKDFWEVRQKFQYQRFEIFH